MWLSKTRALLVVAALAGCGFTPVYGPNGAASGLRGTVEVEEPDNRAEYHLVVRLEERLGQPSAPAYDLAYKIETRTEQIGITPDQETLRYNVTGFADYALTDRATGEEVTAGRVTSFTAYSATGSTVATLAADRDAERRLMVILADQIVTRLLSSAGDWRP